MVSTIALPSVSTSLAILWHCSGSVAEQLAEHLVDVVVRVVVAVPQDHVVARLPLAASSAVGACRLRASTTTVGFVRSLGGDSDMAGSVPASTAGDHVAHAAAMVQPPIAHYIGCAARRPNAASASDCSS